ncbi:MAG: prepilin-type N-terminal cleavage/methylation domain-containing protein [Pirellulales bacterium]|nr:prepilin-type N-terminal cleavage/methylation domain-containing protein [Pirellulales bacterium]
MDHPFFGKTQHSFNPGRTGFTLVELAVAIAMVAALLALVGEMIVFARLASRTMQQQAALDQDADNLLDRITGLPWETIQPGADFSDSLPRAFIDGLAGLTWDVVVTEETDPILAKRITVRLSRPVRGNREQPTVRLTAWLYQPAGEAR